MTIYSLSSGPGISGIAIIRVSGPETSKILELLTNKSLPKPRVATLRKINKINTSELIDEGILLWFPGLAKKKNSNSDCILSWHEKSTASRQKKFPMV